MVRDVTFLLGVPGATSNVWRRKINDWDIHRNIRMKPTGEHPRKGERKGKGVPDGKGVL